MKKIYLITNNFTSKRAQYFFNQMIGHSPYIAFLFTGICKIMQILLIKKVWGIWNSGINIV